jgi:TetR/AcrR family transcriptional regulator
MPGRAKPQKRPRRQPEVSRNAILQAALVEFGQEGLAGARMDAIAEAAEVNKALLYYYFKDKEALYGEILDRFFKTLAQRIIAVCNQPGTAGRRFLSYARTHFDAVAESPYYAHIFMGELMSAGRGGSTHLDRLFAKYMKPIGANVQHLMQEGIRSGEFRAIDPNQFLPSAIGSIIHYFLTAPLREKFMPERFPHPQVIQKRRAAVLDFIAAALFTHRPAGIKLAAQIAQLPDEEFRSQTVRKRKLGKKLAVAPPSAPAPNPVSAENSPNPPSSPSSTYTWLDRTFPDFETAIRIMKEEARLGTTPRNMLPKNIEDW